MTKRKVGKIEVLNEHWELLRRYTDLIEENIRDKNKNKKEEDIQNLVWESNDAERPTKIRKVENVERAVGKPEKKREIDSVRKRGISQSLEETVPIDNKIRPVQNPEKLQGNGTILGDRKSNEGRRKPRKKTLKPRKIPKNINNFFKPINQRGKITGTEETECSKGGMNIPNQTNILNPFKPNVFWRVKKWRQ